jgi:hypothetical protein
MRPWFRQKSMPPPKAVVPPAQEPTPTEPSEPLPEDVIVLPDGRPSTMPPPLLKKEAPRDIKDELDERNYAVTLRVLYQFVRHILGYARGFGDYLREQIAELRRQPRYLEASDAVLRDIAQSHLIRQVHDACLRHPSAHWREEPTHRGNWARFFRGPRRREFVVIVSAERPQVIGLMSVTEFHRTEHDRRSRKFVPRLARRLRVFH